MSWKQTLAWPLHRTRETLGLFAYTRPQTYELTYSIEISAEGIHPLTLAIPLPPQTETQKIEGLTLHLPHTTKIHDKVFGNQMLIANIEPRSEKVEVPVFSCLVTTIPDHGRTSQEGRGDITPTKNAYVNNKDPRIQTLARHVGRGSKAKEKARHINAHIIEHLVYGDPIDGLYSSLDALTRPRVDCGGFNTFFVSLCLANNVPAQLVSGFFLDGKKNQMHAWAEFQREDGTWIPVDPQIEQLAKQGRTHKSGRFGFVGSDRFTLSIGCDIPIEWNNTILHAPILQHPFILEGSPKAHCRAKVHIARASV